MSTAVILCGPTASGKTALAMDLALQHDAEIISADSGQVYRGMDIGTAKPTPEEQARVRFHLIDLITADQKFSAAEFAGQAFDTIRDIESRRKRVLIVGGTGLYLKALTEGGLFEGPSRDDDLRADLERRIREEGVEVLHAELARVDPEAASGIPIKNRQRVIRALEVYKLTGEKISDHWKKHRQGLREKSGAGAFVQYGLSLPKEILHQRIEARVDAMFERGLVRETEAVMDFWGPTAPGLRMIGYKEVVAHLLGALSLEACKELIKKNTRQYAKRQLTWFRKVSGIEWVSPSSAFFLTWPAASIGCAKFK